MPSREPSFDSQPKTTIEQKLEQRTDILDDQALTEKYKGGIQVDSYPVKSSADGQCMAQETNLRLPTE
ncbi:hypothetical protein KKC88_04370 [Patescibacteria group bacterium]|nr:hypothetical protein [Patescibacteria group bacterium]MBU1673967.1 hypothetical protein [Patescibacteria group bacterium]